MVIKNVLTQYAFINRVDDNGNYRVQFKIQDENERNKLEEAMDRLAQEKNCKSPDWWGSFNAESGYYGAKCSSEFKNKKGEVVENKLRVYNKQAQLLEDVPSVANGAIMNIEVEPYYCEYMKKKGIMLGLRSVQLLEYEIYSGGNPYADESGDSPFVGE